MGAVQSAATSISVKSSVSVCCLISNQPPNHARPSRRDCTSMPLQSGLPLFRRGRQMQGSRKMRLPQKRML